jgi:cysteine-rich repeat protein
MSDEIASKIKKGIVDETTEGWFPSDLGFELKSGIIANLNGKDCTVNDIKTAASSKVRKTNSWETTEEIDSWETTEETDSSSTTKTTGAKSTSSSSSESIKKIPEVEIETEDDKIKITKKKGDNEKTWIYLENPKKPLCKTFLEKGEILTVPKGDYEKMYTVSEDSTQPIGQSMLEQEPQTFMEKLLQNQSEPNDQNTDSLFSNSLGSIPDALVKESGSKPSAHEVCGFKDLGFKPQPVIPDCPPTVTRTAPPEDGSVIQQLPPPPPADNSTQGTQKFNFPPPYPKPEPEPYEGYDNPPTDGYCGDSIKDPREECEDGNLMDGDGCSALCLAEYCGDGTTQPNLPEQCDDGNQVPGDGCSASCHKEECGNGIKDPREECEDGNLMDGDGCSALCLAEYCGDGTAQPNLAEQCDDGNQRNGDGCTDTCQTESCGNGIKDPQEECDDGNAINEDGCSSVCHKEYCGDGFTQVNLAEQCDDGNNADEDFCSGTCQNEFCGDGIVQKVWEKCDDGNTIDGDGCSSVCHDEGSFWQNLFQGWW